jgi:tagatose-1,6-bisphosphate aldolase
VGINISGTDKGRYLIASPEKALCDLLMLTDNLRIQSAGAMRDYLENFMRIDMDIIAEFDLDIIRECIETGRKKTTLSQLLEVANG